MALIRPHAHYDVVVVGGGSAGVAAAVGAARMGARVLLVEGYGFLGGAATHSLVLAWCGFYPQRPAPRPAPIVGGIANDILAALARLGIDVAPYHSHTGNWNIRLNPEATKIALDEVVRVDGLEVAYHTRVVGVDASAKVITALRLADPGGIREVSARAFVDTTGDAALAFLAGAQLCPLHSGEHGRQPASYPVRISGISAGTPLEREARRAAMAAIDRRLGRAELRVDGGFMTVLPGTDDVWWLAVEVETNGLDGTDLAAAERDGRALVWRGVEALRMACPGFERANVCATGPNIGIRETRHAATRDPMREADLADAIKSAAGIALAGWPMEIHHGPGRVEYRPIAGDGAAHIPLGALHAADFGNLWFGGRTIGADPAAYASVRVMGTAFATGHAAGIAAALGVADPAVVRRELVRQNAIL